MNAEKKNRLIEYGLQEVEKIAPENSQIEVEVKEGPIGHFYSLIKIKLPHKMLFVKKEGESMYESFHKALRALRSQLARKKDNHHNESIRHMPINQAELL